MKNHIGKNLFWSYIIIAILAVAFNIMVYIYTVSHVYESIEQTHSNAAEKLSYQLDAVLSDGITQTMKVSQDTKVSSILDIPLSGTYKGSQAIEVGQLLTDFGDALEYCTSLESLSLYDMRQKTLVLRSRDNGNKIYHNEDAMEYLGGTMGISEAVLEKINNNERLKLWIVSEDGEGPWKAYYFVNLYSHRFNRPDGVLIGELSADKMNEIVNMYNYEGNQYYLVSATKGYLGADPQAKALVASIEEQYEDSGEDNKLINNYKSMIYSRINTAMPEIYCYYISLKYQYYGALWAALLLMVLNIAALILIVIFLARRFERKNTEPLKRMLNVVDPGTDMDKNLTWNYMEGRINNVVSQLSHLETFWKNDFVSLILNGQETDEAVIHDYVSKNVTPCDQGYRVLGVRLLNISEQSDREILLFCISNILGELLDKTNIGSPVKSWNCVYFILRNDFDWDVLRQTLNDGIGFMDQRLTINVSMGLSGMFKDYVRMSGAKTEADYASEFARLSGMHHTMAVYDIISEQEGYDDQIYGQLFRSLIRKIFTNDYKAVRELAGQIWEAHICVNHPEIMIRRARMLSIVSVISVSYRENGGELNVEDIQQMNIHQLNDIVLSMLDELIRGNDSDKESRKVFDKVSAYIRENFADVNLGAGYITEKFHMSYSYLTGIFKRYAGESIPDYIHKVRIEAAKELLGNGQTVTRAAERVGYADARGFIRAFKKYEGMTPGQYRIQ